jgi:hypothetical protein
VAFVPQPVRQPDMPILHKPTEQEIHEQSKASILQTANELNRGWEAREDVTFCVKRPWIPEPNTHILLSARQENRERFGWESDFSDFLLPFQKNIQERLKEMGEDE